MEKRVYISAIVVFGVLVVSALSFFLGIKAGYETALQDYISGRIDCIIRVQYPEFLKKGIPPN